MLAAIILAPLVGTAILGLFGRRMGERLIGLVACSTVAVSAILSFYLFLKITPRWNKDRSSTSFCSPGSESDRSGRMLLCCWTLSRQSTSCSSRSWAFWIHVFATGYMHGDKGFYRFFAYMNLFMFSMLTLVLADNFLLMFVGWEGVGLCSYLLIGYYFTKDAATDAAKKAFIVNRIGDFGFALGVMLLFLKAGTIFFLRRTDSRNSRRVHLGDGASPGPARLVCDLRWRHDVDRGLAVYRRDRQERAVSVVRLVAGCDGRPDAGRRLIHAATMVTAGVYMVARANSIYSHSPTAMLIVAIIGAATALFAATIGLAQNDIKKVLAYSTVSQLGFMFLACGVGAFVAGIFHVMTHAFFKALLFLGAGSVIHRHASRAGHAADGWAAEIHAHDLRDDVCSAGWRFAGVPSLVGLLQQGRNTVSLIHRRWPARPIADVLWGVGAITALITAVYMTRLMVLTFWGKARFGDDSFGEAHGSHGDQHEAMGLPHESPTSMALPLVVLAAGALFAGYLGVPEALSGGKLPNYFEHLLEPTLARPYRHSGEAGKPTAR